MASALSQRHTVAPLMEATMPRCTACCAMSSRLRREKGRPKSFGNWQARALISTTISGGKKAGSSAPGQLLQTSQALLEEALAPLRYDLSRQVQAFADLLVGQTLSGKEDNFGPHDISIR